MRHSSGVVALAIGAIAVAACSKQSADQTPQGEAQDEAEIGAYEPGSMERGLARPPAEMRVEAPDANARRGRILFTTKGCIICHQVNGVGGAVAPNLDAAPEANAINPLEFSARIWRGAQAMAALQEVELGYVIDLDAQDIADLAAFAGNPQEQALLTKESVPEPLRSWFINAPIWEAEEWSEYRLRGERIPGLEEDR